MALTSMEIDAAQLKRARELTGSTSNREAVDLALKTLIAIRTQPEAVERIIARKFDADQIDAPTIQYPRSIESSSSTSDSA